MIEPIFKRIPVRWGDSELAEVIRSSENARLKLFVKDKHSEALKLFEANQKDSCLTGDWYGEHAGKWLVAAGLTYQANPTSEWGEQIANVVQFLADQQEDDGYLGTYSKRSSARMTDAGADKVRTWDVWIHAWLLLGLFEVVDVPGCEVAERCAKRIGELLLLTFDGDRSPVDQGNHDGLSSLVLLEPLALMAGRWNDSRYSDFALNCYDQAVESGLKFDEEIDASQIGTGKSYQLLWCMQGILELALVTDRRDLLAIVQRLWTNIRKFHLTPLGGPWGGIGTHKEVFNDPAYFDPGGLVEVCSAVTWITLGHRLFEVTGESHYLVEVEKALYNTLIGAIDANGADWSYFTFPNGRRNNTYHWACCKSSGALGLAGSALRVVAVRDGIAHVTMMESCEFETPEGATVRLTVDSDNVKIERSQETSLALFISPCVEVVQLPDDAVCEGDWLRFDRLAAGVSEFAVRQKLHIEIKVHSVDHHGQEIVRDEYVCARLGRFVFAAEKFDGYRTQETLRLPRLAPESVFDVVDDGHMVLRQAGRDPISMVPYWKCGGRFDGAWRTTWLQVAWQ